MIWDDNGKVARCGYLYERELPFANFKMDEKDLDSQEWLMAATSASSVESAG